MKKVKIAASTIFAFASILSFSASSQAATVNQDLNSPNFITIQADTTGFSYNFSELGSGSGILKSNGSITISKKSDVYATLVQWSTQDRAGTLPSSTAFMVYNLVEVSSGNTAGEVRVDELLTSNNKTIGWTNVLPGTYKLTIKNTGSNWAAGNGFVRAYEK
ncbi:hypothetical protein [Paenibacillus chitinolyticus]|uniref:hypothetical protein n=1 Tax=Paenibacillus chitinolyticus TaxID=79263 RepID=UPI00366F79E4